MFLSRAARGNLNTRHWNRRVWEIGYRGPVLPQQKATGRPDLPIKQSDVVILRERLAREYGVMQLLAKPYVHKNVEQDYFAHLNVTGLDDLRNRKTTEKMPGKLFKEKRVEGSKLAVRRRANVGNNLHQHTTVEHALQSLTTRNRWD